MVYKRKTIITMDLISKNLLSKATEKIAHYEMQKKEDKAIVEMKKFLEDVSVALKNKGIKVINGNNFKLELI